MYLGLMVLVMTIFLIINAVYHLGYEEWMKWLYYFFVPSLLAIPPIYYLYIRSLASENRDMDTRTRFILFLPPLVILILNMIIYRSLVSSEKMDFLLSGFQYTGSSGRPLQNAVILHWAGMAGLLLLQILLMIVGTYRILRQEAGIMRKQPRHLAYLQVQWLIVITFCILLFLVNGALMNLFGPAKGMVPALVFNMLMLICGGLAGYYGMKQDSLLIQVLKVRPGMPEQGGADRAGSVPSEGADKTDLPLVENDEVQEIIERLKEVMTKEKPYLNSKFSMHDLCELIDTNRRKVTYVINVVMDKNFYGVVNDYRIEEAIRLLKEDRIADYKMDAISEMVGFRSKSSFYACFKKYTGVTPTEYRIQNDG
jgi:AraC-like DNA-binding protein